MEFMLDTANLNEIQAGLSTYPVDGVTTNPSILKAALPMNYFDHLKKIKFLCGARTLHVQLGSPDFDSTMAEAERIWEHLGKDVYLKVPVTETGLKGIQALKKQGAHITATCIYYPIQGIMAIHAGADYLAPYCNRMAANEIDFSRAIAQMRRLIDRDGYDSKILAASFKTPSQITQAIHAGAHCVTVPPALMKQALSSALVIDAVAAFEKDQNKVFEG